MKRCTRFHVEDVERGDRLHLVEDRDAEPLREVDIVVRETYYTYNFGWVIRADSGEEFYLDDGWDVSVQ